MKGYQKFIVFCVVGGVSALVDLAFFNLAFFVGTSFILARIFGVLISMIFNFSMNRSVSFSAGGRSMKGQVPKYLVVYAVSSTINVLAGFLAVNILGPGVIRANVASAIGIVVAIPFSFFGLLLWAFKKD
jgi:putative flippase GtrA|tara:strand:+ start:1137 stop:1526 length:390 start_codon:yes stop_codon:yes gene_type:complete